MRWLLDCNLAHRRQRLIRVRFEPSAADLVVLVGERLDSVQKHVSVLHHLFAGRYYIALFYFHGDHVLDLFLNHLLVLQIETLRVQMFLERVAVVLAAPPRVFPYHSAYLVPYSPVHSAAQFLVQFAHLPLGQRERVLLNVSTYCYLFCKRLCEHDFRFVIRSMSFHLYLSGKLFSILFYKM